MERLPKKTLEEVRNNLERANPEELKRFALGEQTDLTLDLDWTEDEMREIAKQIVAEREA